MGDANRAELADQAAMARKHDDPVAAGSAGQLEGGLVFGRLLAQFAGAFHQDLNVPTDELLILFQADLVLDL